jgi:hypothetical protein
MMAYQGRVANFNGMRCICSLICRVVLECFKVLFYVLTRPHASVNTLGFWIGSHASGRHCTAKRGQERVPLVLALRTVMSRRMYARFSPGAAAAVPAWRSTGILLCVWLESRGSGAGADPRFEDGSDPSHVWLQMLGLSGSDLFSCLVGGLKLGMDGNFHSVSGSHMS